MRLTVNWRGRWRRWLVAVALLPACLVWLTEPTARAASRGLEVRLRASEAPGAAAAGTVRLYGASHALVIGIDDYRHWPRLSNAVRDAELVAEELRRHGFAVTLKKNVDADGLKKAFDEFYVIKGEDPDARLFVWFAGHGATTGGEGFLVPADAPRSDRGARFKLKALSLRRFGEFVRLAESKHAYAVFDACFAGTIFDAGRGEPPPAITRATMLPVRQFLTSGDAGERVRDDGTFRKLFVRALRGQARADANGDGYLTASELGLFLGDRMVNLRLGQTPRYGKLRDEDYDRGDFVFALPQQDVPVPAKPPSGGGLRLDDLKKKDETAQRVLAWATWLDGMKRTFSEVQSFEAGVKTAGPKAEAWQRFLDAYPEDDPFSREDEKLRDRASARAAHWRSVGRQAALSPPPKPRVKPQQRRIKPAVGVYPKRYRPGDTFKDCPGCPEMVVVPAGSFRMGSPADEPQRDDDEGPQHRVTIPAPFAVGKYEVTFAQWDACVAAGGCGGYRPKDRGWGRDNRPVINVSWKDARSYVIWLSGKTGKSYRLLSEAEWEYVARARTTTRYWWGDRFDANKANNGVQSKPVGSYEPNAFGLYDVHGNVWEWVADCWNKNYWDAPEDGRIWTSGNCSRRVLRGGSWLSDPRVLRSANRDWLGSGFRGYFSGFRLARTLSR
ncbi:MAG: SUMF1/EgtB/PvdO family nonheme iron enzyme [Alphaproteobacteria bacterium]|nr:SUMF1/EgtB/PvdO family nonheme iron enzyme [Alphaproteobacteria bacterium]